MPVLNDPLVVKIAAKGQPLALGIGVRVMAFSYDDAEKKDDLLRITFSDPFHTLVDSEQFLEQTEWVVQWGFPQKLWPARKVLVKRPSFTYGQIEVECMDKGTKLKSEENWKVENRTSVKKIIEKIAAKHQLKTDIDPNVDERIDSFPKGGMSDYDVMRYLESRSEDHVFKIQNDTLVFQKRKLDEPPKATFEYAPGRFSRLLSFQIGVKDQDNAKKSKRVSAVTVDPVTYKKKVFHADEGSTSTTNLGARRTNDQYNTSFKINVPGSVPGGVKENPKQGEATGKMVFMPPASDKELERVAKGKRRKALLDTCEAQFEIVASPKDPFLKSGDVIQVLGIGNRFSGNYRILSITHDLSSGYKYNIKANRNATGRPKGGNKASKKLNGPTNKKSSIAGQVDTVSKTVTGSATGKTYGGTG